ncbi:MAG: holo-ACP synthase [Desulfurella sp.]
MVGIDIEQTKRFELMLKKFDKKTLLRIFSQKELDYCFSKKFPHIHLCGKFCAKEAFFKATNLKIPLNKIEVLNDKNGAVQIYIEDKKFNADVSISHTSDYAVAIVLCKAT